MNRRWITQRAGQLRRRDDGQDLIEYGMLVALIAIAAMVGVNGVATVIKTRFWDVVAKLL